MQTAIDRLSAGKEKEISIMDFDGYRSSFRFVCPECGEYVFPAVGKKNSFKHPKGKGLECDRRVDGQASLTYFERVGLPIYLLNENNKFSLGIGFYALGSEGLKKAQKDNLRVVIGCKTNNSLTNDQYLIDFTFYEDDITIKQLSFIPYYEDNYSVIISDTKSEAIQIICNKWSDYADGFSRLGAIFSYSENKGKKFRKNDTITTSTEYYLLEFDNFIQVPQGIEKQFINLFNVGRKICHVNKIKISPSNEIEFRSLEEYFWSNYKLKLLYLKPQLIQVWPPAIKVDDINYTVPLKSKNNIVCKVSSNADTPKVYRYMGKQCNEISILKDDNRCNYIQLTVDKSLLPISIDRKYLANSQMFTTDIYFDTNNEIKIIVNDLDLLQLENANLVNQHIESVLTLSSNIKLEIIQILHNNVVIKNSSRTDCINPFKLNDNVNYLYLYSQNIRKSFFQYVKPIKDSTHLKSNINSKVIMKNLSSPCIDLPIKYKNIKIKLKKHPQINKLIKSYIIEDRIPRGVLKVLVEGGFQNE